jgi:ABC-type transport system substrate-binding protein
MKRWLLLGLVLWALAACAAAQQGSETYYPTASDVPPSFYDYDPTLQQWYTAPEWNPEAPG